MEGGGGKNRGIGGMSTYVAAAVAAERTEFKGNPRTGSVGTNPSPPPPQSRFGRGGKEGGGGGGGPVLSALGGVQFFKKKRREEITRPLFCVQQHGTETSSTLRNAARSAGRESPTQEKGFVKLVEMCGHVGKSL